MPGEEKREIVPDSLSGKVIGCAIEVQRHLGPGLLEGIYEEALCYEMQRHGLSVKRQYPVPIIC